MTRINIFIIILMLSYVSSIAQKASLKARILNSSTDSISEYIFEVVVQNIGFDSYWVQDTTFLQKQVEAPTNNLIYAITERLENGKYFGYGGMKHGSDGIYHNPCLDTCCNCIVLKKGQTIKFNIQIFRCCTFSPGKYRTEITLRAPTNSCKKCDQTDEIWSDYVYFEVR